MANFCPHCGAQLPRPGAAFCATCGRSLQARPTTAGVSPSAAPQLRIQLPGRAEETFVIARPRVTIGRDPGNDLVLDSPIVSRRHAELEVRDDDAVWRDLGSANGTAVNGRVISEQMLRDGDIIRIGDAQGNSVGLIFCRPSTGRAMGTIQLGRQELGQAAVFIIGRDPSANLQLDHPTVSRLHAEVRPSPTGPLLRDLGSSNGTFVNGELITGPRPLAPRDVVQIGPYKLVYDQAGFAQYTPGGNYRIDAVRLVRRVSVGGGPAWLRRGAATERTILRDVSLSIYPREFVALVGGSGAGKSTLLNAMSGFAPADGRVLVNGDDLYDNFAAYRSILGYVPQGRHHPRPTAGAQRPDLRRPPAPARRHRGGDR
jgi:pSer/pThr/pTyr-binding forkhead associated (FHA) protein